MRYVETKKWLEKNISNIHARRILAGSWMLFWSFVYAGLMIGACVAIAHWPTLLLLLIPFIVYRVGDFWLW